MEVPHFYKLVQERAGLTNHEEAKKAIKAVFGALRDRLSTGGAGNLASQLPRELRDLWEGGFLHEVARTFGGVERMDLDRFLARVRNEANLPDIDVAETVTRAVFLTLREQITPGEEYSVYAQLPNDLKELWAQERPPEQIVEGRYSSQAIGPSQASVQRSDDQMADEISELLRTNDMIDESAITVEVRQGEVTLSGSVPSEDQKNIAERIARQTLGVVDVRDHLTVGKSESEDVM